MKTYQHTQPATVIVFALGSTALICAITSIFAHPAIFTAVFLMIIAWMFRSMTIQISDTELAWHFGSGWPRKRVPLSDIASAEPIRTSFIKGWGIHYTRRGWLYNASGFGAVAIRLRNGKQFCLGTDEPENLAGHLMAQN
jgi:hypothetical protein